MLGDRLRPGQIAGLIIGFVGVSVAAGFGVSDLTGSSALGAGAAVAAAACYGLGFAWMRRHLTGVPPAVAAGGQLTAAALLLAPFALVTSLVDGIDATPRRIGAVLLLGVVGTGVAYLLWYRIIAELGATRASLVTYVIPLVAVAVGIVVLDETFEVRLLVGGALIAVGISLVNRWSPLSRRVPGPATVAGLLVVAALASTTLTGCGDDSGEGDGASTTAGASGCETERREALDPASAVHVLGGAAEPEYTTDPPTSGPHEPAPHALREPSTSHCRARTRSGTSRPVASCSSTRPTSTGARSGELEALAGYGVVVAPNPDLPAPVVATAWVVKQTCDSADIDELERFVDAHWGDGSGLRWLTAGASRTATGTSAGTWHDTPETTRRRLRVAMGGLADVDDPPPAGRPVWFVRHGDAGADRAAGRAWSSRTAPPSWSTTALPPDLPLGYHDLHPSDGGPTTRLIVVPDRCAPAPERTCGVDRPAVRGAVAGELGHRRSRRPRRRSPSGRRRRWRRLRRPVTRCTPRSRSSRPSRARTSRRAAGGGTRCTCGSRTWTAGTPTDRRPGRPRRRRPGPRRRPAASTGRRCGRPSGRRSTRLWLAQRAVARPWIPGSSPSRPPAVRRSRRYAAFCALAEHHGRAGARGRPSTAAPTSPAVARFAAAHADAVTLPRLAAVAARPAAGRAPRPAPRSSTTSPSAPTRTASTRGRGRTCLAHDVRVGAAARRVQRRAARTGGSRRSCRGGCGPLGYEPLAELFRGAFAHGAGLRVDHVMGLFRLFWIPDDAGDSGVARRRRLRPLPPAPSCSTSSPSRAPAPVRFVVGEDLGTVEDERPGRAGRARRPVLPAGLVRGRAAGATGRSGRSPP